MYKFIWCSIVTLLIVGCVTTRPVTTADHPSIKDVDAAAVVQEDATTKIDTEAAKVIKAAEGKVKITTPATAIVAQNQRLKGNIKLLKDESMAKEEVSKLLAEKDAIIAMHIEKEKSGLNRFIFILRCIGVLCIPIGIVVAMKFSMEVGGICSAAGVLLLLSAEVIHFVDEYKMWILSALALFILYVVIRPMMLGHKVAKSSVTRLEQLKLELKNLDNPDTESLPGKKILEKVFGEVHTEGTILNDNATKKLINKLRKDIHKGWEPLA